LAAVGHPVGVHVAVAVICPGVRQSPYPRLLSEDAFSVNPAAQKYPFCLSKLKNARGEWRAESFQAIPSRSRFSRRSLKERLPSRRLRNSRRGLRSRFRGLRKCRRGLRSRFRTLRGSFRVLGGTFARCATAAEDSEHGFAVCATAAEDSESAAAASPKGCRDHRQGVERSGARRRRRRLLPKGRKNPC